jgi:chromosome segregation ATPase
MSAICEICGKEFKTTQGLRGHKTFIHKVTSSSSKSAAPPATEQQLSKLEERLQKLEWVTGLRETELGDPLNDLLSDTEPLTNQLNNITGQQGKLSDIVSKLAKDMELAKVSKATVDADKEEFSKRLTDLREAHNRQATVINEHRDTCNNNFTVLGSRINKIRKMVEDVGEGLSAVRTKLTTHGHDSLKSVPELVSKVGNLEQVFGTIRSQVEHLALVVERKPTDDTERLRLTNGRDHTFRVYRGSRGLTRPHKITTDFISGDKYVDLSEPED